MQSKIQALHQNFVTQELLYKKNCILRLKLFFRFQNSPDHKHILFLISETNIKYFFTF